MPEETEYEKIYEDNPHKVNWEKFVNLIKKQHVGFINFLVKQEPDEDGWSDFTRLKFLTYNKGENYLRLYFEDTKNSIREIDKPK